MERLIDKYLPADYHDTFVLKSRKPAEQIIPKELIKKIFNHSPAWLSFLMKVRNILVKPFGLETGKVLKTEDCIIEDTENEAIMRKDDKLIVLCLHYQDRKRPDRYNNRGSISQCIRKGLFLLY